MLLSEHFVISVGERMIKIILNTEVHKMTNYDLKRINVLFKQLPLLIFVVFFYFKYNFVI